jgi:hypothetical protein
MALCAIASVALASYGCTFDTAGTSGCDGFVPMDTETFVSGVQACAIAAEARVSSGTTALTPLAGPTCNTVCGSTSTSCTLPGNVLRAYLAGQAAAVEAGRSSVDASADAGDAESKRGPRTPQAREAHPPPAARGSLRLTLSPCSARAPAASKGPVGVRIPHRFCGARAALDRVLDVFRMLRTLLRNDDPKHGYETPSGVGVIPYVIGSKA